MSWQQFFELGKDLSTGLFSMTVLALNCSKSSNAVSKLHGEVSRHLWSEIWKDIPDFEIPITHITNGVHSGTWMAKDFRQLYEQYLDGDWREENDNPEFWKGIDNIPSNALWETHSNRKARLAEVVKKRIRKRNEHHGIPTHISDKICAGIDPGALFIGFARRFATYKRATLIFHDEERLKHILNNNEKPVVIFFAGKAHPADRPGQELIRQIYEMSMRPEFLGKIILLENYNMSLARYLVSGVDIWLNNPRRRGKPAAHPARRSRSTAVSTSPSWTGGGVRATTAKTAGPSGKKKNMNIRIFRTARMRTVSITPWRIPLSRNFLNAEMKIIRRHGLNA
ncbi:MAG: alpha-glucan family phosphorylase [Candidatus Marinimicrobia bacterium]|nr:alpha-glucan family phosphorylase [Candidatus Neomarinimicrobiota bacterium]